MAKAKRVTVRLDDELGAIIDQACIDGNCDKTSVILSAIRKGLEVDGKAEKGSAPNKRTEPYDVWNVESGCCSRYRPNGELMFHFRPVEKVNGVQYYTDTTSPRKENRWRMGNSGEWIPRAFLVTS